MSSSSPIAVDSQASETSVTETDGENPSTSSRQVLASPSTHLCAQSKVLEDRVINFVQLSRVCRQGLSDAYRPFFWKVMMGFYPVSQDKWARIETHSEREYQQIVEGSCKLDENGDPVVATAVGTSIDADIPRTMPTLNFFLEPDSPTHTSFSETRIASFSLTQKSLRRITCTAAAVNKGLGYVQGMTQLVGHLLIAFCEGRKENLTQSVEADVFFCYQALLAYLGDNFCRTLDDSKDSGVISTIRHFDNVLLFLDMELYDHLMALGVCSEHYALRWLMLLFTQEFNIADSLRVWDFLLSFGDQVRNAAFYVAAAMCYNLRELLLAEDGLSEVIVYLLDYPPGDANDFLRLAMRWIVKYEFTLIARLKNVSREDVIALRQEYGLQAKEGITAKLQNMVIGLFR